ncbi:unnamed protein product [Cylindrotheca closterium]|uniref:SAP domain-containing protein n=1 Tax=Cylindrotheca closterium TaxID=2856 RepID=A0AAD2FI22_9STRA|nr:unnamed protein product [Cylindrotheca closterium]
MKLSPSVSIAVLLSQSTSAFQPTTVPRRSFELNSLIDQAYDVPSISDTYSRAGFKVADVAATKASVVAASSAQSSAEASAKVAEASVKVAEASTKAAAEATTQVSSAVDEFVKATNDITPMTKTTVATTIDAFKPVVSPLAQNHFPRVEAHLEPLEPGKARPLFEYLQEALLQNGGISLGGLSLEDSKSKLNLLISNTYAMFGQNAPSNLPELSNLPEGSAGWIATATVSLIALGQRNAGLADAKEAMGTIVQKEASAMTEIADELKKMGQEIEKLNKETAALSKELQAAKAKLTDKDLALGQMRLESADKELQLNRAINALKTKLGEADSRLGHLDKVKSVAAPSPVESPPEKPTPLVRTVTDSANILDIVKEMELENGKKKKAATKGEPKTVRVVKSAKGEKKTAAKKKSVKGETTAEAKKPPAKKKAAPKKKAATKKATAKKATAAKTGAEDSWSTLSQSTLTRKTVKQLTDYLSTKGVDTTDEDGKPLKKALLVEAIQTA